MSECSVILGNTLSTLPLGVQECLHLRMTPSREQKTIALIDQVMTSRVWPVLFGCRFSPVDTIFSWHG